MDLVTQATVGAVAALCVAPKNLTVRAAFTGAIAGIGVALLLCAIALPFSIIALHRRRGSRRLARVLAKARRLRLRLDSLSLVPKVKLIISFYQVIKEVFLS